MEASGVEILDGLHLNGTLLDKLNRLNSKDIFSSWRKKCSRNDETSLGEINTMLSTLIRSPKELDFELWEFRADITLLAVPLINAGTSIPLMITSGHSRVVNRLSIHPALHWHEIILLGLTRGLIILSSGVGIVGESAGQIG
jgi:hypothetical protein